MARQKPPPPGPTKRRCFTRGCRGTMRRMFARTVDGKRTTRSMKFHCDECGNETLPFNPYDVEKTAQHRRRMAYAANRQLREARQGRLPYND